MMSMSSIHAVSPDDWSRPACGAGPDSETTGDPDAVTCRACLRGETASYRPDMSLEQIEAERDAAVAEVLAATRGLREAARGVTQASKRLDRARLAVSAWQGQVDNSRRLLEFRNDASKRG